MQGCVWPKLNRSVLSYFYDVVIKQQPEAVALDDGDVVSTIGAAVVRKQRGQICDDDKINQVENTVSKMKILSLA